MAEYLFIIHHFLLFSLLYQFHHRKTACLFKDFTNPWYDTEKKFFLERSHYAETAFHHPQRLLPSPEKKGEPLGQKERELLTKKEIPYTEKICPPLTWSDYDRYDYIFLTDDEEKWPFLKIIGGDPKEKVRLLGEYAGITGNIVNPEKTGQYEEACTASLAACQGLFKKLLDRVAVKTEQS